MKKQADQAHELPLGLDLPKPTLDQAGSLLVMVPEGKQLSPAQTQFNKLMKKLEKARQMHMQEQRRLDQLLGICTLRLLPLVETLHRLNFQMVHLGFAAMAETKLTARRRASLEDLLRHKALDLSIDPSGLAEEDLTRLNELLAKLGGAKSGAVEKEEATAAFDELRGMMENAAREAGVPLDLSDLDLHGDSAEFERILKQRLEAATAGGGRQFGESARRARKPTKAQLKKELQQQEAEAARRRDLKSLYKQLAKVLHPDLESDPERKLHKEEWMKRLTTAHAASDLRELLAIEMEWLGEEASNLTAATDEKLKVYCGVLKEQIDEMKYRTQSLIGEPQYAAMSRFVHPYFGFISPPEIIENDLRDEIDRHEHMFAVLRSGGEHRRQMIHRWADDHARALKENDTPF
ncbi:MAG: hypothetical protein Q8M07_31320 [Prosthecobacter sp.]|nr:hypothetical protein [Prosthecobacter sp.]